jgi:hypothetical protein
MENTNPTLNQITVVDLDLLRNIVNLACTRGAFNAAEAKQVGEIYEKLTKFLEAVVAQAKAQEDAEAAEADFLKTDGVVDAGELPPVPGE